MPQSFPAALRILQSVANLFGADDSLEAINTNTVSDRAIVMVDGSNNLYVLRKESVVAESSPEIIAPSAGPGRWYRYNQGAAFFTAVSVVHAAIPPQSSVDSAFALAGVTINDIVGYNLTDTGLPAGVVTGPVRVTGANAGLLRFTNVTAATVAGATVAFLMDVQKNQE